MLTKMMKYDMPALGRKLGPLYLAWIATALFLGVIARNGSALPDFIKALSGVLYGGVSVAVIVMAVVLVIQRYSVSLLGDGGYFNHALPVKAGTHILSKLITSTVWVLISGLVAALTGIVIGAMAGGIPINDFIQAFGLVFRNIEGPEVLLFIELVILTIMSIAKSILAIYTAITIGHQSQKHPSLCSIAAYIGVLAFEGSVGSVIPALFGKTLNISIQSGEVTEIQLVFGAAMIITLLIGAVYFFVSRWLMTNRLNLQ